MIIKVLRVVWHFLRRFYRFGPHAAISGKICVQSNFSLPVRVIKSFCHFGRVGKLQKIIGSATDVLYVFSFTWGGGACEYLTGLISKQKPNEIIVVLLPTEVKRWLNISVWKNGMAVMSGLYEGIDNLAAVLPSNKKSFVIVNQLVSWGSYCGAAKMDEVSLKEVVSSIMVFAENTNSNIIYLGHDYYCICPLVNMINSDGRFCFDERDSGQCEKCIRDKGEWRWATSDAIDVGKWRDTFNWFLQSCEEVRTFSYDTAARIQSYYQLDSISVVPHAPVENFPRLPRISKYPLVVGVFGGITYEKGQDQLLALARLLAQDGVQMAFVGAESIAGFPDNCTFYGRYNRQDLPLIVEKLGINVAMFASVCPETFSYVVQEEMMLGLPVVCFDIGAPKDRVKKYDKGRVVSCFDVAAAYDAIKELYGLYSV